MGKLSKEITESNWYKKLPVVNWEGALEEYQEKLAECGVDLETLDKKYLAFVANLMFSWKYHEKTLSLLKIFEHLEEAWQRYELSFDMGFCDISLNIDIAVKDIKEKYYKESPSEAAYV